MFTQIKTSAKNKEAVTILTRKFGLGAENVIARIAITYSLQSGTKFSPLDIKDSGGKNTQRMFFSAVCIQFMQQSCANIIASECQIKICLDILSSHLDDGLELIMRDVKDNPNLIGFDYLFDKIELGLNEIC